MRFLGVVALGLMLAASAWGQTSGGSSGDAMHSFGSAGCSQRMPCPDEGGVPPAATLAAKANVCITQYFGYTSSSGFFDESQGLDSNNCLSAIPDVLPKGVGRRLSPLCCITKLIDNSCILRCDLVTLQ